MDLEKEDYYRDLKGLYDDCKKCMYYHVTLKMNDGNEIDGIIENVAPDRIIVLVGEDATEPEVENKSEGQRQYSYNYGRPRMRYRRFRRQAFPLATLAALSLLPYPVLPPYPYPVYYPYY